ncbi:MAG: PorT family protein [Bacteroidetes bacterium]|nr:PorT family protein [Bacteroidota bacterium]
MKALFIISLLVLPFMVRAQDGYTSFGVRLGMVSSSLRGMDVDSLSPRGPITSQWSLSVGILANSRMTPHFWLKHEVNYTLRTMTLQMSDASNNAFGSTYSRHYVDIFPISPTYHIAGFQVYAGPYLGLLAQAYVERKDAGGNITRDYGIFGSDQQFGKQHQKMDLGLVAGIEYELPFGLNLGAKYIKGFVPVVEYANANTFSDPNYRVSIYNESVVVTIGYSFVKNRPRKDKDSNSGAEKK